MGAGGAPRCRDSSLQHAGRAAAKLARTLRCGPQYRRGGPALPRCRDATNQSMPIPRGLPAAVKHARANTGAHACTHRRPCGHAPAPTRAHTGAQAHHVVGALVEVAHARDVVLAVLANHVTVVADHHCSVQAGRSTVSKLRQPCAAPKGAGWGRHARTPTGCCRQAAAEPSTVPPCLLCSKSCRHARRHARGLG